MILPFAMLTGAMLCFSSWNRSNEFVAVRGFGQSVWAAWACVIFSISFWHAVRNRNKPDWCCYIKRHEAQMAKIFGKQIKAFLFLLARLLRDKIKDGKLIIRGDALNTEMASIINP